MSARHLVAGLHPALHREVDLHHLQHARREVVPRGELPFLVLEVLVEPGLLCFKLLARLLELVVDLVIMQPDFEPLMPVELGEVALRDPDTAAGSLALSRRQVPLFEFRDPFLPPLPQVFQG